MVILGVDVRIKSKPNHLGWRLYRAIVLSDHHSQSVPVFCIVCAVKGLAELMILMC